MSPYVTPEMAEMDPNSKQFIKGDIMHGMYDGCVHVRNLIMWDLITKELPNWTFGYL